MQQATRTEADTTLQALYDNPDEYLTYGELSQLLNVSVRTLRRWVSFGVVPYVKLGGWTVRFPKAEVAEWLRKRKDPRRP